MLNFIYYPVSAILWFWHNVLGAIPFLGPASGITWTLSVVLLVFTLRLLLFKPFVSQVRSMRKMQEFAPEIQKLKKKYGNDKQKMAAEMQKLQSEQGVNPLGGCLPVLVQVPVFIGLFHVLRSFNRNFLTEEENRTIGNYVFSAADVRSFLDATLFGSPLSAYITQSDQLLARFTEEVSRFEIGLVAAPFAIAAGILTHLTARHSVARQSETQAANPQAAIMNKVMLYLFPVGVLASAPFFPLAILIYFLSNNLWTLAQQRVVYKRIDAEEATKKEAAVVQRQALGPRPGQKPKKPKRPADTPPDTDEQPGTEQPGTEEPGTATKPDMAKKVDTVKGTDTAKRPESESTSTKATTNGSAGNGSAPAKATGGSEDGSVPGMIQPRARAKKKSNKGRRR